MMSRPAVVGDALSHWRKLCNGRRGVAFCTTVAHAQAVAEQWRRAGYRAVAVHGGSDDAERREAVAGLRAGRLDLVACAQLWIAGVDVPEIDAVIWLRPTQSLTAWLQGNGRGLRIAPNKRDLLILDHVGNCGRLDHPLKVHKWSLNGRRKRQREAAPSVKVCPKCFAACSSRVSRCEECGHEFAPERRELETVDGELVEHCAFKVGDRVMWRQPSISHLTGPWEIVKITATIDHVLLKNSYGWAPFNAKIEELTKINSKDARREQGSAQSLQELTELGRKRGYKNPAAWARYVIAARQTKGQWSRVK